MAILLPLKYVQVAYNNWQLTANIHDFQKRWIKKLKTITYELFIQSIVHLSENLHLIRCFDFQQIPLASHLFYFNFLLANNNIILFRNIL